MHQHNDAVKSAETVNAVPNTETNTETEEKKFLLPKIEKAFVLPNGSTCVVKKAKGKHSIKAADMALILYGSSPTGMQVMNCLMSLVTTVNGDGIRPDELEELWAEDYSAIQSAYMDLSGGF